MGKLARKYVESIEECKYIERGTTCGVCGKKLGYFYEGFWSNNSKNRHLIDGVLCGKCHEHFNILIKDTKWASEELRKQPQWKKFTSLISESYTAEDIKWFFEQKEASDKEIVSAYGSEACGLYRIKTSFGANTHPLSVGVVRHKKLYDKTVVFGKSEESSFQKGDRVNVYVADMKFETTVLEAFVFDPEGFVDNDMYVNFNKTIAANLGYTRKIKENKIGWLILDINWKYKLDGGSVVKIG